MKNAAYFADNETEFMELTEEQQQAVLNGGIAQGDTETTKEVVEETNDTPDVSEEETKDVLLAKDGKNIIPFEQLTEARQKAAHWEDVSNQQAEIIKQLQAAKAEDKDTGTTDAQDALIAEYSGEFPEIAEDIKPWLESFINKTRQAMQLAFDQKLDQQVKPLQQFLQEAELVKHFAEIAKAHPDYEQVAQDPKLQDFINSQPSFVRQNYQWVFDNGSPQQVSELLSAFKQAHPVAKTEPDAKNKAKEIISGVKPKVPNSLSDIPASANTTLDETEQVANMSPTQLENYFNGKSPEQINKILARLG